MGSYNKGIHIFKTFIMLAFIWYIAQLFSISSGKIPRSANAGWSKVCIVRHINKLPSKITVLKYNPTNSALSSWSFVLYPTLSRTNLFIFPNLEGQNDIWFFLPFLFPWWLMRLNMFSYIYWSQLFIFMWTAYL